MKHITNTLFTILLLLTSLYLQPTWAAKLYKWVDENGVVSYQDMPPPSGSKIVKEEELATSSSTATDSQNTASNSDPVDVYTIENCESCEIILLRLQNWGIPTNELSLQDRDIQAQILQTNESLQAPTLRINNQFISNTETNNLLLELREAGYAVEGSVSEESQEQNPNSDNQAAN